MNTILDIFEDYSLDLRFSMIVPTLSAGLLSSSEISRAACNGKYINSYFFFSYFSTTNGENGVVSTSTK